MLQNKNCWIFLISLVLGAGACKFSAPISAVSLKWAFNNFSKLDTVNPILTPNTSSIFFCPIQNANLHWESKNVLNPTALVKNGKVYLIYRAQDSSMTSRLGLAISEDGMHFKKSGAPIFYPTKDSFYKYEWKGGVEDPRIVSTPDGGYLLTYTSYDGKTARLCFATSIDLMHWEKRGPVLKSDRYINTWSKSGAVVVERMGENMVAKKINGKYWMYFGDTDLFMAYSTDLLHWEALENEESKKLVSVLAPRAGFFDSRLVEPGPYALYTKQGIVLIYNSSNAANNNDISLPKYTYAAGQALFDTSMPYKLLDRSKTYFIHPDKNYELIGEVNNVCFVEGLVYFKNKWILYYGTADSKIAMAVAQP
jgi:beta-1,2-mannosidase